MSWVQSTLGEVADIFSGYAFKSADMNSEGGTPLIKIKVIPYKCHNPHYTIGAE